MYTIMCNYIPVIRLNYANFRPCGYICLYIMGSTLSMIWYLVKALLSCAIQNRPHRCCLDHPASISPECSHGHHGSAVDPAIISSLDLDVARHVVVNPLYAHLSGAVGIRGNPWELRSLSVFKATRTSRLRNDAIPKHLRILR